VVLIRAGYVMRQVFGPAPVLIGPPGQKSLPIALPPEVQPPLMVLPEIPKRFPKKRGHAARPGTGPVGETCGSCAHYRSKRSNTRSYPKCELARAKWTSGSGTDIRKGDPACERWSAKS